MTWSKERHKAVRERLAHVEFPDYEHLVLDGTDIDWIERSQHDGSILAGATVAKVEAGPGAAEMFFHAPTDLADALEEIERLQGELTKAWEQGAEAAWKLTGEGWNAEYAGRELHHLEKFRDINDAVLNPYRKDESCPSV